MVDVVNFRSENLVFAVFTPSLGQTFQFNVRRSFGKDAHGLPLRLNGDVPIVGLNGVHFVEVEGQQSLG